MHAIYSITPKYANAIHKGTKTIELRKIAPAKKITRIYFYTTSPISRIELYADVKILEQKLIPYIWEKYKHKIGMTKNEYEKYFKYSAYAVPFELSNVHWIPNEINLTNLIDPWNIPISYRYLTLEQQISFQNIIDNGYSTPITS